MDEATVSCVIVSYRRPDPLAALLGKLNDRRLERIVVNITGDRAVHDLAREHGAIEITTDANVGYAAGVNAGVRIASAPTIMFSNDDLEIAPDVVLGLARVIETGGADVVAPRVVDAEGVPERTILPLPSVRSLVKEWLLLPDRPSLCATGLTVHKWRLPERPERVPAVTGAVVVCRRDLLMAQPLPEAYFLYWEESEWFWHLARRSAIVEYHPEFTVRHLGGRGDIRPEKSALLARNAVRCIRRTGGRIEAALVLPVVIAWQLRLLVVDWLRTGVESGNDIVGARRSGVHAALGAWRELR